MLCFYINFSWEDVKRYLFTPGVALTTTKMRNLLWSNMVNHWECFTRLVYRNMSEGLLTGGWVASQTATSLQGPTPSWMMCHERCTVESHFQLLFLFLYTVASESSHSWFVGMNNGWNPNWGACGHSSPLSVRGVPDSATITIVLAFVVISFLLCYHGYGPKFSLVSTPL